MYYSNINYSELDYVDKEALSGRYFNIPLICSNGKTLEQALKNHYNNIPDYEKYCLILDCLIYMDIDTTILNMYIADIKKYRPDNYLDNLPDYYKTHNSVRIYRAGTENISQATCSLSWTLDGRVAEWYGKNFYYNGVSSHIYMGYINKNDIIAYLPYGGRLRKDFKALVVQYNSVQNVREKYYLKFDNQN